MIIIAAVDDRNGMMFNKRRQSQDRVLRERILSLAQGSRLWMNQYTKKQFEGLDVPQISVDEDFLSAAGTGEFCFVENTPVSQYAGKIEQVILFRWNRSYPGDFYFDLDLHSDGWRMASSEEFPGSSHEKITMEVYAHEI